MTTSNGNAPRVTASTTDASRRPPSSTPAPHEKDVGANCGPMSRQDVSDAHGHDMHPQEFVQLVGCHESDADAEQPADKTL
jgi:hypothetical protein